VERAYVRTTSCDGAALDHVLEQCGLWNIDDFVFMLEDNDARQIILNLFKSDECRAAAAQATQTALPVSMASVTDQVTDMVVPATAEASTATDNRRTRTASCMVRPTLANQFAQTARIHGVSAAAQTEASGMDDAAATVEINISTADKSTSCMVDCVGLAEIVELEQRVEAAELRAAIAESVKELSLEETVAVAASAVTAVAVDAALAAAHAIVGRHKTAVGTQTEVWWDQEAWEASLEAWGLRLLPCSHLVQIHWMPGSVSQRDLKRILLSLRKSSSSKSGAAPGLSPAPRRALSAHRGPSRVRSAPHSACDVC